MISPLASQVVGRDKSVLVMRLPSTVTDEQVNAIREEVRSRLPRQAGAGLVIDMEAVELINSIGITCLLQVEEDARKSGARAVLAAVPPAISQFLRQLKLDRKFRAIASVDEAVQLLEAASAD
ncbi:MAG: STAS domain-containing protein [Phycisphaerales bacterium]